MQKKIKNIFWKFLKCNFERIWLQMQANRKSCPIRRKLFESGFDRPDTSGRNRSFPELKIRWGPKKEAGGDSQNFIMMGLNI